MNTDKQNIPNVIFDYLQQYAFAQLNKQQKNEVLAWLEQDEYDQLHEASMLLKPSSKKHSSKQFLLNRFDQKYKNNINHFLHAPIALWKVAAVFVVLSVLALQYYYSNSIIVSTNPVSPSSDTVYVEKSAFSGPIKIHDTIFINEQHPIAARAKAIHYQAAKSNLRSSQNSELNIVSIAELNSEANNSKGNSIKNDSLIHHFKFVKL